QHRLYRRPGAEDRGGDAAHAQFRPQILERDQGGAGQYGAASGDGDPELAAGEHRGAGQADRRALLTISCVMAGLDPAISMGLKVATDPRVKPGDDVFW